jgi:predicted DNA-binding transcriptional regulator AlpA
MSQFPRIPLSGDERVLSDFDCAELLGIARETLQIMRRRGDGPPYCRVSKGVVRYLRSQVVEWLASRVEKRESDEGNAG